MGGTRAKGTFVKLRILLYLALFLDLSLCGEGASHDPLLDWMNQIAQQQLEHREKAVAQIRTVADAERRKQLVRQKILDSLGGLPKFNGPLNARETGRIEADGYTIEKVIFESLPKFFVTANVYRPNKAGRYPAILVQSGHSAGAGKPEPQRLAANLALKGFVALTFDPIGQGERIQSFDPLLGRSVSLTWAAVDHVTPGAQALMLAEGVARYFIWDAKRALDYLESRPDVDAARIAVTGCSGGGALTTFIGALDPRVKAVAPGCFVNGYRVLFTGAVPHAEMNLPEMLARGIDDADFVELSAPTPWLILATEGDFFTPAGTKIVYDEAKEWFKLYGAQDKIRYFVGSGPHGTPRETREAIYQWMTRWLKDGQGDVHDQPVKIYTNYELNVTSTGQVVDEPGSRRVWQLLLEDLHAKERQGTSQELHEELRRLQITTDHSSPGVKVIDQNDDSKWRVQHVQFESEPGIMLSGTLYIPHSSERKPAVVLVKDAINAKRILPSDSVAQRLAGHGCVVLQMEPRDSPSERPPEEPEAMYREYESWVGNWLPNTRANLIGRNLAAMRARDILRGVDVLAGRGDVDPSSIYATARGVKGIWLLMAAAVDPRIRRVWLDRTPHRMRAALRQPVAMDLSDAIIPGFILHWDLDDLVKAAGNQRVLRTDPTGWTDQVIPLGPPFLYRYLVYGIDTDLYNQQAEQFINEFIR
jgi:cephalosporin-C deacetylase-like acetyl esterase